MSAESLPKLINPNSWLGVALQGSAPNETTLISGPLVSPKGKKFPQTFPTRRSGPGILVVIDGGNGALKISTLMAPNVDEPPRLLMRRVEVCYALARQVRTGAPVKTFTVNGGVPIRIGQPFVSGAQSIRTGSTAERMNTGFYRDIMFSAIADTLHEAGYQPDKDKPLPIYLGYIIPTDEFSNNAVIATTDDALKSLRGTEFVVQRSDRNGSHKWNILVENTGFAPQTQGVFYALQRGIFADVVLEGITRLKTLDIGFGHEQILTVEFDEGEMTTSGGVIGKGMILVAERLIELVDAKYGVVLNHAQAQYAIITNKIDVGQIHEVPELVKQALDEVGEVILQKADNDAFTDQLATLICSGGGTIKLEQAIHQRIKLAKRRDGTSLVLPAKVAAWANNLGGFARISHEIMRVQPWKTK